MCGGGSYPDKHNPTRAHSFPWTPMEHMGGPQCLLQRAMLPVTEAFFTVGTIGSFNSEQIECKHQNASCVPSSMIVCWGPAHRLQVSRNPQKGAPWPESRLTRKTKKGLSSQGSMRGTRNKRRAGVLLSLPSESHCPQREILSPHILRSALHMRIFYSCA